MSSSPPLPPLPITEVLADIKLALTGNHELILEAPPGAGKTTLVPLALLDQPWLGQQRIVMLEPRRMAARSAAQRMASILGEKVGETVGFRVRQETKISNRTRIEVITEGILSRMLLSDPSLAGIGLIIFDEFHERSLDADTGLALTLQGRALFREPEDPLKLMLMSATLNGQALSQLLPAAPVIRSEGKMFAVDIHYGAPYRFDDNIVQRTVDAIINASRNHLESMLVFLPGQKEIQQVMQRLTERLQTDTSVHPLYGALSLAQQQQAINPPAPGQRKIVLATDIAESSLTIEGITVVIDSGLSRQPEFDPTIGMTRLRTRRISQDSSTQRAGRAGRLSPGHCYRLWSAEQQQQLNTHRTAEILQADLAPLLVQLISWGVDDLQELDWLDAPPKGTTQQALDLLQQLGVIGKRSADTALPETLDSNHLNHYQLTEHGKSVAKLPTHPRLAHMLIIARSQHCSDQACALAAILTERSPLSQEFGSDLGLQVEVILGKRPCHSRHKAWLQRVRQQVKLFERQLLSIEPNPQPAELQDNLSDEQHIGLLVACAYPERIARKKNQNTNTFQLANGQIATINSEDPLSGSAWIAIAELGGFKRQGESYQQLTIFSAASFDPTLLDNALDHLVRESVVTEWDDQKDRFIAEQRHAVGNILIRSHPVESFSAEERKSALTALIRKRGLNILPWDNASRQWQARVQLARELESEKSNDDWPDVTDDALLKTLEHWLGPYLEPIKKLSDFQKLDLTNILSAQLPWSHSKKLEQLAPQKISVPSGSFLTINYLHNPPVLQVKLQEMFGCADTPTIANGSVTLTLHLLSPAQRPLQVTQDLAGFWKSSYFEIKKEMKGRYPKHPWPDNPEKATPTRFTKRRS